ncbi:hypothetical protein [Endozoicomonas euniceicola]|uniref:Uncharacterized protein n=1 Tax=Endozoicomonas euniceicola TaxID=1234143 RepID=A0ABY6GQL3_9GAMM|nr:hypothetical protein [Endozoicomonas euniceicola]UYM15038.1 hypothetical protein NX720_19515 [Endozoicomonas euniceicola]
MNIKLLPGIQHDFKIIQFAPGMEVLNRGVFSVTHTDDELSIICESSIKLNSEQVQTDWSALKVTGFPIDVSAGVRAKCRKFFNAKARTLYIQ